MIIFLVDEFVAVFGIGPSGADVKPRRRSR